MILMITTKRGDRCHMSVDEFKFNREDDGEGIPKITLGLQDGASINTGLIISGYTQVGSDLYVIGSCSAQSFIDRTPFYDDDALTELSKIKGTKDGEIDHETLPSFAQVNLEDGTIERDIGNMVSIITKAIQQIIRKFKKVETKLTTSEKEVLALSDRISKIEMMLSATDESEDK